MIGTTLPIGDDSNHWYQIALERDEKLTAAQAELKRVKTENIGLKEVIKLILLSHHNSLHDGSFEKCQQNSCIAARKVIAAFCLTPNPASGGEEK